MIKFQLSGTKGLNPAFPLGPFNYEGGGGFVNFNTSNWPAEFDDNLNPQYCTVVRDTAEAGGAPAARSGASSIYVVRCETTQACKDGGVNQHNKFYQIYPINTGSFTGNALWGPHTMAEGGEKGQYVSWQYFPSDLIFTGTGATGALFTNFFWKHFYYKDGVSHDEVQNSFGITNKDIIEATYGHTYSNLNDGANHDRPVLFCNPGRSQDAGANPNHFSQAIYLTLGAWTKFSGRIYPGIKTELYVNDVLFETYTHDVFTAGVRHKTASSQGGSGVWPELWTFGVGYYGFNVGKLWLGDTYAEPIPEIKAFEPFNPGA